MIQLESIKQDNAVVCYHQIGSFSASKFFKNECLSKEHHEHTDDDETYYNGDDKTEDPATAVKERFGATSNRDELAGCLVDLNHVATTDTTADTENSEHAGQYLT